MPTDDARAIRRAYAARLKALDPDDHAGFVVLRQALEAANDWWWDEDEEAVTEIEERVDSGLEDVSPINLPLTPSRLSGQVEADGSFDTPAWHTEADAIAALAWGQTPSDDAARHARDAALVARAEGLLASPALEEVANAQAVEDWLAWLIVDAMPRADALIEPGRRRFDWDKQALDWNCSWQVRQVIQRCADLAWLASQPRRSAFGQGWAMLTDPARFPPCAKDAGVIETSLGEIDARHPTLRADLDDGVVERWEASVAERRARPLVRARRGVREVGVSVGGRLLPALEWLMTGWRGAVLWVGFVIGMMALLSSVWKALFLVWGVIGALHLFAWLGRR